MSCFTKLFEGQLHEQKKSAGDWIIQQKREFRAF